MAFWTGDHDSNRSHKSDLQWMFNPPRTPRVILTDRGDGSLWLLTFNTTEASSDGLGYISIVQPVPERPDVGNLHVYGQYDGPHVRWVDTPVEHSQGTDPQPTVVAKLFVRDGYLGFETVSVNVSNTRVIARQRVQRINREIIRPTTYAVGGPFEVLAWRDLEF